MEKNKAVVAFCVEGQSEIDALRDPIESLFGKTAGLEDVIIEFRQGKGDVTAEWYKEEMRKNGNTRYQKTGREKALARDKRNKHEKGKRGQDSSPEKSEEEKYAELFYSHFFEPYDQPSGLCWNDVTHVIQIIDIDGVYSKDEICLFSEEEQQLASRIEAENQKFKEKGSYKDTTKLYFEDHIAAKTMNIIGNIEERKIRKTRRIDMIREWDSMAYKGHCVNFGVYYFSINLDHFLSGDANLCSSDKIKSAGGFKNKYGDAEAFTEYFLNNEFAAKVTGNAEADHAASWKYLWKKPLCRATNLNLLIRKIQESKIEDWMQE